MKHKHKGIVAFTDRIFGKELSLEHLIFLCGSAAGIILSAFGTIGNLVMGLNIISVIIPFINFAVDVSCVIYSVKRKKWRGASVVVFFFATFVLFPFLWFTTGGTMSSSLPLVIGLGVVLAIVFDGKLRIFFVSSALLLYSAFIIYELYFPNNFIPYPDRESMYLDVLFGFVLSFLATCSLAYFTLIRYKAERRKTEMLIVQLEETSYKDSLTKVYNRRHLMVRLDEEMRKSYDSGASLTLCIMDIDDFKKVNDTYGHVYGDEVLVKIAQAISDTLSENEIFGRYGGEEFVVVFVGSDLTDALSSLNRIYAALDNIEWANDDKITASCGISTYTKGVSYSNFLESADAKLYKAKNSGRNRIEY
jgi:diguanylate cyclase (GGDEF) domain